MRTWDKSKPPTGPFALNRDAPQAENLVAWYPMGGAGTLWVPDYVGSSHLTMGTDPGLTVGQSGAPVLTPVLANSQYLEGIWRGPSTLPLTLAGWTNTRSSGSGGAPICLATNGATTRIQIQQDLTARVIGAAVVNSAGSGNTIAFTSANYVDNIDFHAACVFTSSTSRQAFINGVGGSVETANVVTSGFDRILFGGRRNATGVGFFYGGQIGEWGVWAQSDDAAMLSLRADPGSRFELWYPLRSKRWISFASGGAANINLAGILTAEAVGTPVVGVAITTAGIPTAESVGAPVVQFVSSAADINFAGIPTAESIGAPVIGIAIASAGILSAESIGAPVVSVNVAFAGIPSAESVGAPVVQFVSPVTPADINFAGIPSAESVGAPGLMWESPFVFTSTPGRVLSKKKDEPIAPAPVKPPAPAPVESLATGLRRTQAIIDKIQADIKGYKDQIAEHSRRAEAKAEYNNIQNRIASLDTELSDLRVKEEEIRQEIEDMDVMFVASVLASM